MSKLAQVIRIVLGLAIISSLAVACGPPEIITETWSEAEFNEEEVPFEEGLVADLQPGKIVLTGEIDGAKVIVEMTIEVADGGAHYQLQRLTVDGKEVPPEEYADVSAGLAEDVYVPEEGYAVTDVTITDDELTITSTLQ